MVGEVERVAALEVEAGVTETKGEAKAIEVGLNGGLKGGLAGDSARAGEVLTDKDSVGDLEPLEGTALTKGRGETTRS